MSVANNNSSSATTLAKENETKQQPAFSASQKTGHSVPYQQPTVFHPPNICPASGCAAAAAACSKHIHTHVLIYAGSEVHLH
jgi:hypothetical protein